MKANIELRFDVIVGNEEIGTKIIKIRTDEMSLEFLQDFCAFYNGKTCKVTMSPLDK